MRIATWNIERLKHKMDADKIYKRSPDESLNRIIKHIKKALPKMDEEELRLLLKG